jgi:hypothetical protein
MNQMCDDVKLRVEDMVKTVEGNLRRAYESRSLCTSTLTEIPASQAFTHTC